MDGWNKDVDPASGNVYYYNTKTGESQWDPPAGWKEEPDDDIPLPDDDIPLPDDDIPLPDDDIPLPDDDIPLPDDDIPLPDDDIPLPDDDIPLPDDDIPLPDDDIPMPDDEVPMPDDDVPMPDDDDVPVPKDEDSPASVEEKKKDRGKTTYPPFDGYPIVDDRFFNDDKAGDFVMYAKKYFSPQSYKKGKFSSSKASITDLTRYSPYPIKKPLHKDLRKSKLSSECVKNYKNLLKICQGDPNSNKLIISILSNGIEHKETRDEIYAQVIKQSRKCDSGQYAIKCWEMLVLVVRTFPSSSRIEDVVRRHLVDNFKASKTKIVDFAFYTYLRYDSIMRNRSHAKLPSPKTIERRASLPWEPTELFGAPLTELMWYQRDKPLKVPEMIVFLTDMIKRTGYDMEGIFRVSGEQKLMNKYKEMLNVGNNDDSKIHQGYEVAALFKLFFREMFEPLIPFDRYSEALRINGDLDKEVAFIESLPKTNRDLLVFLVKFIRDISKEDISKATKMDDSNLTLIFAPNILREQEEDEEDMSKMRMSSFKGPQQQSFLLTLVRSLDLSKYDV